jgi:hypothetical protein
MWVIQAGIETEAPGVDPADAIGAIKPVRTITTASTAAAVNLV